MLKLMFSIKGASFILLLPAAVNWLHQKAKTDRWTVLALLFLILLTTWRAEIQKNGIQNLFFCLWGSLEKDLWEIIICSSFPRFAESHAEKTNITMCSLCALGILTCSQGSSSSDVFQLLAWQDNQSASHISEQELEQLLMCIQVDGSRKGPVKKASITSVLPVLHWWQ